LRAGHVSLYFDLADFAARRKRRPVARLNLIATIVKIRNWAIALWRGVAHWVWNERMGKYAVKEIFRSLQGEGANAGAPPYFAVFRGAISGLARKMTGRRYLPLLRYGFCWHRRPGRRKLYRRRSSCRRDRERLGGRQTNRFVVFTGGEPLLQLDAALIGAVHVRGFEAAVETNGTLTPPPASTGFAVSPKAGAPLVAKAGSELKLVFPAKRPAAG